MCSFCDWDREPEEEECDECGHVHEEADVCGKELTTWVEDDAGNGCEISGPCGCTGKPAFGRRAA